MKVWRTPELASLPRTTLALGSAALTGPDPVLEFDQLAESRPEMVMVDAFALSVPEIFFDHPEIRFGGVDPAAGQVTALPNVSYVDFRNEEGALLAGSPRRRRRRRVWSASSVALGSR